MRTSFACFSDRHSQRLLTFKAPTWQSLGAYRPSPKHVISLILMPKGMMELVIAVAAHS
jgi:hypothetical protein